MNQVLCASRVDNYGPAQHEEEAHSDREVYRALDLNGSSDERENGDREAQTTHRQEQTSWGLLNIPKALGGIYIHRSAPYFGDLTPPFLFGVSCVKTSPHNDLSCCEVQNIFLIFCISVHNFGFLVIGKDDDF